MKPEMKAQLNDLGSMLITASGTNSEMRNASRSSLVPNRQATINSLTTEIDLTTAVKAAIVSAALTISRCGAPLTSFVNLLAAMPSEKERQVTIRHHAAWRLRPTAAARR